VWRPTDHHNSEQGQQVAEDLSAEIGMGISIPQYHGLVLSNQFLPNQLYGWNLKWRTCSQLDPLESMVEIAGCVRLPIAK
jgi:hypothetical protein